MRKEKLKARRICRAKVFLHIVRVHLIMRRSPVKILGDMEPRERKVIAEQHSLIREVVYALPTKPRLQVVEQLQIAPAVAVQPRLVVSLAVVDRRDFREPLRQREGRLNRSAVLCRHHISAEEDVVRPKPLRFFQEPRRNVAETALVKVREVYNAARSFDFRAPQFIAAHNEAPTLPLGFKKGGRRNADRRRTEREEKLLLIQSKPLPC